MQFHEFGDSGMPCIMLIHGGGNAWWNYLRQARALESHFHVVLPTLDGHGEEYFTEYTSTEDQAKKLVDYVDGRCNGRLFLLGGVSLGGQIAIEMLSQRSGIADRAIIDGALCIPQPRMANACIACVKLFRPLMFGKAACRMQLWMLNRFFPEGMRFPDEIERLYLEDMPRLRSSTLVAMYRTYMGGYQLKDSIKETAAHIEFWYGEKEMQCVKESAQLLASIAPSCIVREATGCNHGTLAIYQPRQWLEFADDMLSPTWCASPKSPQKTS